jgi:glycosyltransferase involved in cell wall biosynthesis
VHTILEAMPEIISGLSGIKVMLTVLGDLRDSGYVKKIEALIQRLNMGSNVEFQQVVPETALFDVFQKHDIFLFPSLYEPFSLTLIHAMESGIPVVASNVGGNPEIVFPGRTGLLFDRGDARGLARAVLSLANTPGLRRALSIEARKEAQKFMFQHMVHGIEAYLKQPGF